jgi:peptide/nickel transport system substrate-binding protein
MLARFGVARRGPGSWPDGAAAGRPVCRPGLRKNEPVTTGAWMNEQAIRSLVEQVQQGRWPRRQALARLVAAGLSLPMASVLLMNSASAQLAGVPPVYKPTRRGGGGALRMLYWQGPTQLNPHFATGAKDSDGCRLFHEPLATWDADANLQPVLAAEIPSRANGGLSADGKSVLWKLKRGVSWHDGAPFSADDVVFNAQYASDPATAATTVGVYKGLRVEKVDTHTVRVVFDKPTPFWPQIFASTLLIPRHLHAPFIGAKSREAPANFKPVGTGPYKFVDFKPGDLLRGELNPGYHMPLRPHFDTVELKGGGDAVSAARAVLQTGEYDFAWNLLVEDEVLKRMEAGGKGRVFTHLGSSVEFLQLNYCDPATEIDGERSHPKSRHPVFRDPAVRQAMGLLLDRVNIQAVLWGRAGVATANIINSPARFRSPNTRIEFSLDKANAVLDGAGWKRGAGGVREKGGHALRFVFQTSVNGIRQKTQAILKQTCQQAGIALELKAITAAVFFSSDTGNPDTAAKFGADMQMYGISGGVDPERGMDAYVSWELASKANQWQGRNISRWRSEAFDAAYRAAEGELDPVKRAALFIRMNDLLASDQHVLALMHRADVDGLGARLVAPRGFGNSLSLLHDWYRET